MEETPDTVVSLISGKKWSLREQVEEVLARITAFTSAVGEAGQEWVSIQKEVSSDGSSNY